MRMKQIGRGDLKLILALLLIGLLLTLLAHGVRREGRQAAVRVNGQIVARLPLDQERRYEVETDGAVTNILVIEDGAVRMIEADCPDHLCVRRGAIRYAGDSIVCLPNRVVIEISGEDALDLDAVTG